MCSFLALKGVEIATSYSTPMYGIHGAHAARDAISPTTRSTAPSMLAMFADRCLLGPNGHVAAVHSQNVHNNRAALGVPDDAPRVAHVSPSALDRPMLGGFTDRLQTANLLALPSSPFAKLSCCGSHAIRTHSTAASSLAGFGIQNSTNSAKRYRDRIRECLVEDDIASRKSLFCVVECPTMLRGSSAGEVCAPTRYGAETQLAGRVLGVTVTACR